MIGFWLIDSSILSQNTGCENHTRAPVYDCNRSRTAADQCAAAAWLQVQLWRGPGKFLTPVPKYLDLSRPTLTDDFLKVKRYAFRSIAGEEFMCVHL